MAISSRPCTRRTVSLIDVSISSHPKQNVFLYSPQGSNTHMCTCTKRHCHYFPPLYLFQQQLRQKHQMAGCKFGGPISTVLPLCILQEDCERLSENKLWCDVTSLNRSCDCYINQQQRLKYSQWSFSHTSVHKEVVGHSTFNSYTKTILVPI